VCMLCRQFAEIICEGEQKWPALKSAALFGQTRRTCLPPAMLFTVITGHNEHHRHF